MSPLPTLPPPPALYYSLLAGCLLLGIGLMALAWRRPNARQRALRMLAGAVAAAALWFTAFPPSRQLPAARAEAILLTEGYAPDTLRQLRRQLGAGTPVWAYGNAKNPGNAQPLASLLTLAEQRPPLHRLHILGHGLSGADLPMLGTMAVRQHPGSPAVGFRTAFWPAQLPLGDVLQVEGAVERPMGAGPGWVVLRAAGAGRDSMQLAAGSADSFRLRYQPKAAGLATYELLLRRPGQPPIIEPVPVEITSPALPAVLLLAATPSFEFKFLKNALAEARYPVALRTSVSRGLMQTDFVNQPRRTLDRLTPALLARYAIVVADAATLSALSPAETQALRGAISNGRLGLVTLAEAAPLPRNAPARTDFTILPRTATPASLPTLTWPTAPGEARAPLPAQLQARATLRPLVTGPQQLLAAASHRFGLGAVVVSVVPETFRWGLQGHSGVYASFWNRLGGAAVPAAAPPAAAGWQAGTRWPRLNQPLTLQLAAGAMPTAPPTIAALAGGPGVRLALRQDTRLPEWSTAQFWPGAAGWYQVRGPGPVRFYFYVYPAATWLGPELLERQQALSARVTQATQAATASTAPDTISESWPAGWFFGLFLLATGYLWLEEKL